MKRLRPRRAEDMKIQGEASATGRADLAGSPTRAPRAAAARGTRTRQPRWGARGAPAPMKKRKRVSDQSATGLVSSYPPSFLYNAGAPADALAVALARNLQ